jgi:hypothetical protein
MFAALDSISILNGDRLLTFYVVGLQLLGAEFRCNIEPGFEKGFGSERKR